ncbi:MAG TPA: zinc-dependent alcohol dehydrogenase family protein [Clostridia bacterium]|nr:zinc-dependent alcohol dehydrogenase family protein [Clostridia bacterium]
MKAVVIDHFGPPEVFHEAEISRPRLKDGYVLVKVHASSVNPIETKIRSGLVPAITPPFPAVLNGDFSGVVTEVGGEVADFKAGDEVFGCAGGVAGESGVLAEYMLADARLIWHKPGNIDHKTAALYPLVSITAYELLEKAQIKEGDKVLIHGIAGGVGHIVLQLAKMAGAKVYGTVSGDSKGRNALVLGADAVINYREGSVEEYVMQHTGGRGFDVVIDTVGGENLLNSFKAVKLNGTICTTNSRVSLDLGMMHRKAISLKCVFILIPLVDGVERQRHGVILKGIKELIEDGSLKILKAEKEFRFTEAGEAHSYLESGKAEGKIALISPYV